MNLRARFTSFIYQYDLLFQLKLNVEALPARLASHPEQKSWSQHGEDSILADELQDLLETGFYLDIGANHPSKISNTFRLYCLGMRGITVEPIPAMIRLHQKCRPEDVSLCSASGAKDGLGRFYRLSWHALSTFSFEAAQESLAKGLKLLSQSLVPVFTVKTILENCNFPTRPNFALLSVDVESLDEIVLRSNDWERYRPRLIIFEQNDPKETRIGEFLTAQGYAKIASPGCNQIWKSKLIESPNAIPCLRTN